MGIGIFRRESGQNKWNLIVRMKQEMMAECVHVGSTENLAHRPPQFLNMSILISPFKSDFLWYV